MIFIVIFSGGPLQVLELNLFELLIDSVADLFADRHGFGVGPPMFHFGKVIPRFRFFIDTDELIFVHDGHEIGHVARLDFSVVVAHGQDAREKLVLDEFLVSLTIVFARPHPKGTDPETLVFHLHPRVATGEFGLSHVAGALFTEFNPNIQQCVVYVVDIVKTPPEFNPRVVAVRPFGTEEFHEFLDQINRCRIHTAQVHTEVSDDVGADLALVSLFRFSGGHSLLHFFLLVLADQDAIGFIISQHCGHLKKLNLIKLFHVPG